MITVSLVGYFLVFLAVVIMAARWTYLNHPALRDADRAPCVREGACPPGSPVPRD
ncbi:hypothetical protein [Cupriavidus pauculus]|uniref:hypothetical protein n=1 Tax=Cupriavidus pauculus TaxID=82633 RepID=UPI001D0CC3BE|nr:hypothetical protein [Cupriavidus pauculus]